MKITKLFSTPYHPQFNDQVEAINKIIKYTLKMQLEDGKGSGQSSFPIFRITCKNSTGETPFSLVFGTKIMVLAEFFVPRYRTSQTLSKGNDEARLIELDLLEEKRLKANMRNTRYKQNAEKYYNS